MNLPEGWPTEEMIEAGAEEIYSDFPGSRYTSSGPIIASSVFKAMIAVAPTPPAQERIELPHFDAGSLPDFIDGDAELWQDAIRNLLEVAHEHYQEQVDDLLSMPAQEDEPVAWQIEYTNTGLGFKLRKIHTDNVLDAYVETYPDAVAIPLYTRPADDKLSRSTVPVDLAYLQSLEDATKRHDKLRKAAEEIMGEYLAGIISADTAMAELRVALEKK